MVRAAAAYLDHGKQHGFVLFEEPRLRIAVRRIPLEGVAAHKLMPKAEGSVGFTGLVTATRVIRAGGTVLDLWRAPAAGADFAAARAGRCRRAGQRVLADGMRFTVDGRSEAWTIARQTGDMLLLDATARQPGADLAIEYDAATGAYRGASATDGAVARIQLMATLLRLMGRRDAVPALAACAGGGPFFQRWHMARTLAALDRVAAAPLLDRLGATDPHPEVRAAAAAARALIAA